MRYTLAVLLLGLAACSSPGNDSEAAAGRIAMVGADGNIAVFEPATEAITAITDDAGLNRFYSQPTWSPDGSRLALAVSAAATLGPGLQAEAPSATVSLQAQGAVESAIHLIVPGEQTTVIEVPFPAFYLYWSPDGTRLAFLGNDTSRGELRLGIIEVAAARVDLVDEGQPYYFAWSPESDRLLVHRADRELFFLALDGTSTSIGASPGGFSAPAWAEETLLVGWEGDGGPTTRFLDVDGSARGEGIAYEDAVVFGLSPAEDRYAYINVPAGANPFSLGRLLVMSETGSTTVSDSAAAFFWDQAGSQLLYLTPEIDADTFALRWNVWDGATSRQFEPFLPTATFIQQYLPFFGQYANSLSFFSPDGETFTFAGRIEGRGEGIWVQAIDGDQPAQRVGPGEFSTWSP